MASRTIHNPVQGDTATFLETSADTGGAHTLIEILVKPGGGVPEHFHNEFDEAIIAVDGPLKVTMGKQTIILQPGERVTVPRGVPHTWRNASSDDVTFRAHMVPGTPGFENALRVIYGVAQEGGLNGAGVPRDLKTFALMIRWGDTNITGPLSVLTPILNLLARRAEKSGFGTQLRQKYDCDEACSRVAE